MHLWKLIHVFGAAVILLVLRVLDGLLKAGCERFIIGAVDADPVVVLFEFIDSLDLLEFLLELVLDAGVEASKVAVKGSFDILPLSAKLGLDCLAESVEDHCHLESSQSSLEADFRAAVIDNEVLLLVLLVSMVELWDLTDDPECLSVKLLL